VNVLSCHETPVSKIPQASTCKQHKQIRTCWMLYAFDFVHSIELVIQNCIEDSKSTDTLCWQSQTLRKNWKIINYCRMFWKDIYRCWSLYM